jgi:hypothetical protein
MGPRLNLFAANTAAGFNSLLQAGLDVSGVDSFIAIKIEERVKNNTVRRVCSKR